MQQLAGNDATRGWLDSPSANRSMGGEVMVSRYDTGEHAQLGGARGVKINGVAITEGELIAMGDFFATPDDVFKAGAAELNTLVALIRRARAAEEGKAGAKPVSSAEWEKATGGRYLKLAKKNETHFAPAFGTKGAAGKDHRGEWRAHHTKALDLAHAHATTDMKVPPEATARNAFAGHFLTDAFSAGHIVPKSRLMEIAEAKFKALKTSGSIFIENAFTKKVARLVLADPRVKPKVAGKQLRLVAWGDFSPQRFSELLWQLQKKEPEAFYSAFAKIVHDQLNQAIEGGKGAGIEVMNDRGDVWELSGDETLKLSPKTTALAKAAMDESYQNLEKAAKTTGPLDYEALYDNVWSFTPKLTPTGVSQVRDVAKTYLDAGNPKAVAAFAEMAAANIDVALAELKKENRIRKPPPPVPPTQWCFVASTPIALADGTTRAIGEVEVGDRVLGYDTEAGRLTCERVTATFRHPPVATLSFEYAHSTEPLRVTAEHPMWSEDRHDWVPAGSLRSGERMLRLSAEGPAITKITRIGRVAPSEDLCNLSTTGEHDYFAGGVLAHNKLP